MSKTEYIIPEATLIQMKQKFRMGVSLAKLQAEFGYPYYVIQNRVKNYSITIHDRISNNLGAIQRAENAMIGGQFPNYYFKFPIYDYRDHNKYKSLLHLYATADLNEGNVFINEELLKIEV